MPSGRTFDSSGPLPRFARKKSLKTPMHPHPQFLLAKQVSANFRYLGVIGSKDSIRAGYDLSLSECLLGLDKACPDRCAAFISLCLHVGGSLLFCRTRENKRKHDMLFITVFT